MDDGDDIFDQLLTDTKEQIVKLKSTNLNDPEQVNEYNEVISEIQEVIQELYKSVEVIHRSDVAVANAKESQVKRLEQDLNTLITTKKNQLSDQKQQIEQDATGEEEDFFDEANVNPHHALHQQMMNEQSDQLDTIHLTMGNLQQQARTMGDELLGQSELLDNLNDGVDTISGKLSRGRRQLEWIYEKNSERMNDCCIGLLIVVLIVLLVIAIVV